MGQSSLTMVAWNSRQTESGQRSTRTQLTWAPQPPLIDHMEEKAIAKLAYCYWESRGCPFGSPEEDWLRAEKDLQRRYE